MGLTDHFHRLRLRADLQRQVQLRLLVDLKAQPSLHKLTEALGLHRDRVIARGELADHIVAVLFTDCTVCDVGRDIISDLTCAPGTTAPEAS